MNNFSANEVTKSFYLVAPSSQSLQQQEANFHISSRKLETVASIDWIDTLLSDQDLLQGGSWLTWRGGKLRMERAYFSSPSRAGYSNNFTSSPDWANTNWLTRPSNNHNLTWKVLGPSGWQSQALAPTCRLFGLSSQVKSWASRSKSPFYQGQPGLFLFFFIKAKLSQPGLWARAQTCSTSRTNERPKPRPTQTSASFRGKLFLDWGKFNETEFPIVNYSLTCFSAEWEFY